PSETQVFSGNHVARQKAEGIEFADIREFVAGDRVRHVNWRATARRGELWVNEHHAERNADVVIFLEVFAQARRVHRSTLHRAATALLDLRARGFDLIVVEISPLAFVVPKQGEIQDIAHRLWRLRRDAVRGRFERAGVPVAIWDDDSSLTVAMEEVETSRRQA